MKNLFLSLLLVAISQPSFAGTQVVPKAILEPAIHVTTGYMGKEKGDCGPKGCCYVGRLLDFSLEGIKSGNYVFTVHFGSGARDYHNQAFTETNPVRARKMFRSFVKLSEFINPYSKPIYLDANYLEYPDNNHNAQIECFQPAVQTLDEPSEEELKSPAFTCAIRY